MNTLFFDLDGTLTDSRPGIVRSIQHALQLLDQPVPTDEDLLWCIGPPLRESFTVLLGGEERADQAVALYRERFSEVGLFENRIYAGIEGALSELRAAGMNLHVVTSKPLVYAERIVAHFGLGGFFGQVFGAELSGERSDKTELIAHALHVLNMSGTAAIDVVMVGDRSHDMLGALNNGVRGIGVLYGYGSRMELQAAGAEAVIEVPGELGGLPDRF